MGEPRLRDSTHVQEECHSEYLLKIRIKHGRERIEGINTLSSISFLKITTMAKHAITQLKENRRNEPLKRIECQYVAADINQYLCIFKHNLSPCGLGVEKTHCIPCML